MNKISVCIATYNGEKFIKRQLESILSQLENNDEVIISDDSSTDDTLTIIREINDDRIKVFPDQKFRKPAPNFGNAISKATGDYIFLSDQDDIWKPDKVKVVRQLLSKYDLVVTDCEIVDNDLNIIEPSMYQFRDSGPGLAKNFYKNTFLGCCMSFKKEFIPYILPIPKSLKYEHDWLIGLVIQLKGKVCFSPLPLIYYVRHGENASIAGTTQTFSLKTKIKNRMLILLHLLKISIK